MLKLAIPRLDQTRKEWADVKEHTLTVSLCFSSMTLLLD